MTRNTGVMDKSGPNERGATFSCFSLTTGKGMMRKEGAQEGLQSLRETGRGRNET